MDFTTHESFELVFRDCEYFYNLKTEKDFSTFRSDFDTWWFILGDQIPDHVALEVSKNIDSNLYLKYLQQKKSALGYSDELPYVCLDECDSRHIMMSTFIFGTDIPFNKIVEIGGGYGNWIRLNYHVQSFETWSVVDLPFVIDLQKWYIENELGTLEKINFINSDNTEEVNFEGTDLVIASHSLSELSWSIFEYYCDKILKNTKYLFYAFGTKNLEPSSILKKCQKIEEDFIPIRQVVTQDGDVKNILLINKNLV